MNLGHAIKAARKAKKLTQPQLGEILGVSKAAVSQWETGENMPDPRRLAAIFAALDMDPRSAIGVGEIGENATLQIGGNHPNITTAPANVRHHDSAPALPVRSEMRRIIPVLGVASGGPMGADFNLNDGNPIAYAVETPAIAGRTGIFALYVQNDSMSPWREPGQLVYVDPHQRPKITDYVVVELKPSRGSSERAAYLKKWAGRSGNTLRLEQYKPHKTFTVDQRQVLHIYRVIDWTELLA